VTAIWPRLKIDASAFEPGGGTFILDYSALDGPDVLAEGPDYVWVPDADIRRVSIRRGGRRWRYDAGEVVVELDNSSGNYDPDNSAGDYAALGRSLLVPGMMAQIHIRTYDYYESVAFTGRLSEVRVNPSPINPTATWVFVDELAVMSRIEISTAGGAVTDSKSIAEDLLNEGGISPYSVGEPA
jgi:hypothetical protein